MKRYRSCLNLLLAIATLSLISACGPRLKQIKNYQPPASSSGMLCVQQAAEKRTACKTDNASRLNHCYADAQQQADELLIMAERDYTRALEDYIEMDRYHEVAIEEYKEQQRLILRDGELAYVRCSKDVNLEKISQYPGCKTFLDESKRKARRLAEPIPPVQPRPPNRQVIVNRLNNDCRRTSEMDCDSPYDKDYISCGGIINYETICVSNCN